MGVFHDGRDMTGQGPSVPGGSMERCSGATTARYRLGVFQDSSWVQHASTVVNTRCAPFASAACWVSTWRDLAVEWWVLKAWPRVEGVPASSPACFGPFLLSGNGQRVGVRFGLGRRETRGRALMSPVYLTNRLFGPASRSSFRVVEAQRWGLCLASLVFSTDSR